MAALPPQQVGAMPPPEQQATTGPKLAQVSPVNGQLSPNTPENLIFAHPENQQNPDMVARVAYASNADPALKRAAADQHTTVLTNQQKQLEAEKLVNGSVTDPTGRGGLRLAQELKRDDESGSYIKAYLYHRLGLADLAKNEQQKLGAGDQWAPSMVDGRQAWIKYNGQGAPVKGYTADGEMTPDQLVSAQTLKGATTHTQAWKDGPSGELYFTRTTAQGPQLVSPNGKIFSGDTSNLHPYGIGSDIELQGQLLGQRNQYSLQALQNKLHEELKAAPVKEWNTITARFNAENKTKFPMQSNPFAAPGNNPIQPLPGAPTLAGQPRAGEFAPAAMTQANQAGTSPVAPVAIPANAINANPSGGPVAPNAMPAVGARPVSQPTPTAVPTAMGGTPTPGVPGTTAPPTWAPNESMEAFKARKKIYDEEMASHAKDQAKIKEALPANELAAGQMLATLHDVTTHPGFKVSVGASEPVGNVLAMLPGTEARDWKSKYSQLMGQEFLDAFNNLRGGGSISDTEGKTATKARAALSDPGISKAEFIRNANILENTIRDGINRQRAQAGLQPKTDWGASTAANNDLAAQARAELERRKKGQ